MTAALWKNIIMDISKTKARFISIVLIVALGVGFFTGVKATSPSMNSTAELYYSQNNLMDIRLLSTVGFNKKDIECIKEMDHVCDVMPSYYTDAVIADNNKGQIIRLFSNPSSYFDSSIINKPLVKEGRLPEKPGEIALENADFNKGDYSIGSTFTLDETVSGNDVSDTLEHLEYTVVGFVQSPLYVSYERGSTTAGNGRIHMFGLISPLEFNSDRYTQLYVLTDYSRDTMRMNTICDEFNDRIDEMKPDFEALGEKRAKDFDKEYLIDARQKLKDAQQELDSEKDKASKKLSDAKKKIDDGQKEFDEKISDAEQKLSDAKEQISSGEESLKNARIQYDKGIEDGQKKLDESKKQLNQAQQQLDESKKQYAEQIREAEKKLSKGEREYNSGLEQYNAGLEEFKTQTMPGKIALAALKTKYENTLNRFSNITKPASEKIIQDTQAANERIDEQNVSLQAESDSAESDFRRLMINQQISANNIVKSANQKIIDREYKRIEDGQAEVDEAKTELDQAQAEFDEQTAEPQRQLHEANEQLTAAKAQLDSGKAELAAQKQEAETRFAAAQQAITEGQTALANGQTELSKQKTEGKKKLSDSEAKLKQAKADYQKGKEELEKQKSEGEEKLLKARADYESGKKEAEENIGDAQAKLDAAREKLEDLENPEWYFFTRLDNPGYKSLADDTTRVDAVAAVFPLFFLLVAALVCLTTLKRHVDEKRTETGTLKALGYSNNTIKMQYVFYATAAALAGCVLGISVGLFTLPYVIYNAYGIMYELLKLHLVFPVRIAVIGVVTAFLCTTAVALYSCQRSLSEKPAELMRPKAPKIGKRILLEKLPFIWNRMNFTSKVTARNIARYKARFCMTVIGVAGCTALILTGFGLKNSIGSISDKQFGELYTYDMTAILDKEGTAHQNKKTMEYLSSNDLVDSAVQVRQTAIEVSNDSGESLNSMYLLVPQSADDMKALIHLRKRVNGESVELNDNGVVITEKAADILSVKEGDTVTVLDNNNKRKVTINGISENYINGYIFMTPKYYSGVYGKMPLYNMIICKMNNPSEENESKLGAECLDKDSIAAVSFISSNVSSFKNTISSMDTVILVLIICAGLLAVVVLYNLTNINIAERIREIATIKVLGFYNSETCAFVYRENIVLTICGIAVGLGLGIILHRFVILTIEVNGVMFDRNIALWSYFVSIGLTAVFAAMVNFVMYFKIKKIDMVESLKSVE